ncbi:pancreatic lipase-related protein 2-like [Plodia interpunctella]|uniref:pancreatic lipase-related protein 2-like n=1 Tax=Plodia interpunctella TaxID=58824 RepID=UPI002368C50B|nr:pancreatic lipase-related protein 2-like [Plodia interpunctella]
MIWLNWQWEVKLVEMKYTLALLFVSLAYTAHAVPIQEATAHYQRHIQFPGDDGLMHDVDLEDEVDEELLVGIAERNAYYLFTRLNPDSAQTLVINDADSIRNSNFNPAHNTVVVVHGWLGNQNTGINGRIRDAYLGKGDANVIVLDWRRLARSNYVTAVRGVPIVGVGLGQFVRYLVGVTGASYDRIHLVGFSLGGHLVGNAGRELEGRVARITALDPAGPLWVFNSNRINSNDGRYVEGIHTNGALIGLGYGSAIGHVDFFPNGGESQPGCLTPICDHNRAWEFFASTVSYNHLVGRECSNSLQISLNTCRGNQFPMGNDHMDKHGSGRYRVNTKRRYPY